jgi:hypothetical protein
MEVLNPVVEMPLLQCFVAAEVCISAISADNLSAGVKTAVRARPLLVANSVLSPDLPTMVVLGVSDVVPPVAGSSATVVKAFVAAFRVSLYVIDRLRNGFCSITPLGDQVGLSPFVPSDNMEPVVIPMTAIAAVRFAVVSLPQLVLGGVPGYALLPAMPADVIQAVVQPIIVPPVGPVVNVLQQLLAVPLPVPVPAPVDETQRKIAILTALRSSGILVTGAEALHFLNSEVMAVPPAAVVIPPAAASLVSTVLTPSQGIVRQNVNAAVAMGLLNAPIVASFGLAVIPAVVRSVVASNIRLLATSSNASVATLTEKQCLNLIQVPLWDLKVVNDIAYACATDRVRNSSDKSDFLSITCFLRVLHSLSEGDAVPSIVALFDYLRYHVDAQYITKEQIVECLLDIIVTFYGTAFAMVVANPQGDHQALFSSLCRTAVQVPTELNSYLQQLRLSATDKEAALLLDRSSKLEAKMLSVEKRLSASSKSPRTLSTGAVIPPVSTVRPFPCHRWLNGTPCAGSCGFYHDWPATVTADQKSAFKAEASGRGRRTSAVAASGPPRSRANSPAAVAMVAPVPAVAGP